MPLGVLGEFLPGAGLAPLGIPLEGLRHARREEDRIGRQVPGWPPNRKRPARRRSRAAGRPAAGGPAAASGRDEPASGRPTPRRRGPKTARRAAARKTTAAPRNRPRAIRPARPRPPAGSVPATRPDLPPGDDPPRAQQGHADRHGHVGQPEPIEPQQPGRRRPIPKTHETQGHSDQDDGQAGDHESAQTPQPAVAPVATHPNTSQSRQSASEGNQLLPGETARVEVMRQALVDVDFVGRAGRWPRRSPSSAAAAESSPAARAPARPAAPATSTATAGTLVGWSDSRIRRPRLGAGDASPSARAARPCPRPRPPSRPPGRETPRRRRTAATPDSSGSAPAPPGPGRPRRRRTLGLDAADDPFAGHVARARSGSRTARR